MAHKIIVKPGAELDILEALDWHQVYWMENSKDKKEDNKKTVPKSVMECPWP